MNDLSAAPAALWPAPEMAAARRLTGRVAGLFVVPAGSEVESVAVDGLQLQLEGVPGDRHYGFTRKAGSREPWYPRGTVISNIRQLSVVSAEELAEVAARLRLSELRPEWVGANLVISGVPHLSYLPAGTRLHFADGASLAVAEPNAPCRKAGRAIAAHCPGRKDIALGFAREAQWLRGIVATVERPGSVTAGSAVEVRVPQRWIYPG